jgi:D-alanyl-D-alanine carboxypeptidase
LDDLVEYRDLGGLGAVIVGVFEESSSTVSGSGEDGDGRRVDGDRPWETASLGKVFTAVAVLQLVDAGLVDLDAPVADYVDFPMSDQIIVRHVMQHRSGIRDMRPVECPDESTVAEIEELAGIPTEPTGNSGYSNTNYLVLGQLIGSVTGQDPGDYIRENVFAPLGMENTYWSQSQEGPSPWWPKPESTQGVGLYDCGELGPTIGTDGAAVTTVTDMDAFYRGLFGGALLEDETLDDMLEMDNQLFGLGYGLGVGEMVDDAFPGDRLYGFGGEGGFYGTFAFHDPTKKRTVAVFTTFGSQITLFWQAVEWANQQTER